MAQIDRSGSAVALAGTTYQRAFGLPTGDSPDFNYGASIGTDFFSMGQMSRPGWWCARLREESQRPRPKNRRCDPLNARGSA